jgi:starch synthase
MPDETPEKKVKTVKIVKTRQPRKKADPKKTATKAETKAETKAAQTAPDAAIPEMQPQPVKRPRARRAAADAPLPRRTAPRKVTTPVAASTSSTVLDAPPAAPLSVLMVASEAHPFAKTGGLAEVAASLTDALGQLGHQVTLVLPRYRQVAIDGEVRGDVRLQTRLAFGDRLQPVVFYERRLSERVTVVFVDAPELFDREGLYGTSAGDYPDNALRFAVFSRAALEYPRLRGMRPSVIHAHDWQAGLVPVYQKMHLSNDPFVGGVPAVFTIHNLAFQGVFPASTLPAIGLGFEVLDVQGLEFWGNISYLKGGINFSEKITTVSPGYAMEIVQPEFGFGFEGVLARRAADLVGILNGIDTARWTPTADEFVPASFSADDRRGKRDAKRAVLSAAGLPVDDQALARPLIGLISRLTDQKGFDLIVAASRELMALDAAWVMLGSGERRYEDAWRAFAASLPDRVSTTIGFDERLAHLIEAGADMFLMPSRFEPCGLNQMYSLRYGTVPIVRATGGLNDTVTDADAAPETGTGFKFVEYSPGALVGAVHRALAAFGDAGRWAAIAERGMREDHSWDASAREYVKVYRGMLNVE